MVIRLLDGDRWADGWYTYSWNSGNDCNMFCIRLWQSENNKSNLKKKTSVKQSELINSVKTSAWILVLYVLSSDLGETEHYQVNSSVGRGWGALGKILGFDIELPICHLYKEQWWQKNMKKAEKLTPGLSTDAFLLFLQLKRYFSTILQWYSLLILLIYFSV